MTYETSTANTNSKLLKYLKSTFTNYFVTDTSGVIKDYLKNLMHGHLQEKVLASNFEVEGNNKHTDHEHERSHMLYNKGVTKRCRPSLLTNKRLRNTSPNAGGGGICGVSAN
jgi:hypothetical protein